ncbi:MAG: Zn-dependent hydrolase [Thermoprotei archaeon]|nr:MAG: Zn-dependent hydrolase [Thermoprotei archaeon]
MLIRWHGHACFEIKTGNFTIVLDPHDGHSLGIKPPRVEADVVLITHEHFDHNAYQLVAKGSAKILRMAEGEHQVNNVKIRGVKAYHDTVKGRRRGEVVMYRVEAEGISVAHLGDLGHVLEDEHVRALRPVDVLLVPVGGVYTVGPHESWQVIELLDPQVVIPMHYWVEGLNLPLKRVDNFLGLVRDPWSVERLTTNYVELKKESIPSKKILILTPP